MCDSTTHTNATETEYPGNQVKVEEYLSNDDDFYGSFIQDSNEYILVPSSYNQNPPYDPRYKFQFCVLGSGSKGNSTYYEPNSDGNGFLVDIGFSDKRISSGLAGINKTFEKNVSEVLITHKHGDHLPKNKEALYNFPPSWTGTSGTTITSFPLIHDVECYGFLIETKDGDTNDVYTKVAHVTDTGDIPTECVKHLLGLNALVVEANWDEALIDDMIDEGKVPIARIEHSIEDHFSNQQMASLIRTVAWEGLEVVVLIHLSESNNAPDLARQAAEEALGSFLAGAGGKCRVVVSEQDKPTGLIILKGGRGDG